MRSRISVSVSTVAAVLRRWRTGGGFEPRCGRSVASGCTIWCWPLGGRNWMSSGVPGGALGTFARFPLTVREMTGPVGVRDCEIGVIVRDVGGTLGVAVRASAG